jgi:hypothetical protein
MLTCPVLRTPLAERPGSLKDILEVFARRNVNLQRIESRPSPSTTSRPAANQSFDFHVTVQGSPFHDNVKAVVSLRVCACVFVCVAKALLCALVQVSDLKPICERLEFMGPREGMKHVVDEWGWFGVRRIALKALACLMGLVWCVLSFVVPDAHQRFRFDLSARVRRRRRFGGRSPRLSCMNE